MTVLQNIVLATSTVKMRWQEPYVTAGLNEKSIAAFPKGVVAGFKVLPNSGYNIEIQADPTLGLSVANVLDTGGSTKFGLTVVQAGSLFVDLTAQAGLTVFIAIDAQYSVGSPSGVQLKVVNLAELSLNPDLVLLARVDVPLLPPVLASHINMGYRTSSGDATSMEARPPVNLVNNGTFERDLVGNVPAGWVQYAGIGGPSLSPTVVNTVARTGTQSMRLNSVAVAGSGYASFPVPMQGGQTARASMWIRSTGADPITGGGGVRCTVVWLDADYTEFSASQLEGAFSGGSTVFEQRQDFVTAPAGTAFAQLLVYFNNCSGTLYVDDAEFVVRLPELLAQTAVFGGAGSVADAWHAHTAAGQYYAGGPNWADGTTNPPTTIEAQLDKIITDVGGVAGAAKVGFTPSTPVDLTTARVDLALNELDDKKAGLFQPNSFTKNNTFNNTVANSSAVTAYGVGTGSGVVGYGGNTGSGGAGVVGSGRSATINAHGVFGSPLNPTIPAMTGGPFGVVGVGGDAGGYGHGVLGIGNQVFGGSGIVGIDWPTTPIPDASQAAGGLFAAAQGNPAVYANGGSNATFDSGYGLLAVGGAAGAAGVRAFAGGTGIAAGVVGEGSGGSGPGGYFIGGGGGTSARGVFGQGFGTGELGAGVYGLGTGTGATGVFGDGYAGAGAGVGVIGQGGGGSGSGVEGRGGSTNGAGVYGIGAGTGTGLMGRSSGAPLGSPLPNTGVYGIGTNVGGVFRGSGSGLGAQISGGTTNGSGMEVIAYGSGLALEAFRGDGNNSSVVIQADGYIRVSGDNPTATQVTGFSNVITPKNFVKCWGKITTGPSPAVVEGFNLKNTGAITISVGTNVTIAFNSPMLSGNYVVNVNGTGQTHSYCAANMTTVNFDILGAVGGVGISNFNTVIYTIMFTVYAAQ